MRRSPTVGLHAALLLMPGAFAAAVLVVIVLGSGGWTGPIAAQVLGFALPAWIAARLAGSPRSVLALVAPPPGALVGAVLVALTYWYLAAVLLVPLVEPLATEREAEMLAEQFFGPSPLALKLLGLAVVPAVCEEILVRGAITRGLSTRLGLVGAALVSSGYFALLHGSLARLPITFLLGLVLAMATLRSRSLIPAIAIHAGNNAAAVLLTQPELAGAAGFLAANTALFIPLAGAGTGLGLWLLWARTPRTDEPIPTIPNPS